MSFIASNDCFLEGGARVNSFRGGLGDGFASVRMEMGTGLDDFDFAESGLSSRVKGSANAKERSTVGELTIDRLEGVGGRGVFG